MAKEYVTIQKHEVAVENVIEKSRFISAAIHVDSVEEAMAFVAEKRKKYYDATHNCYAYVVGDKAKFSDDGEPQGTAGMPIYDCIKNNGLDRVCVVVTRYFGGVKLGAGGLVRAYSGGCADVLKACVRVPMTQCVLATVEIDYSLLKTVRKALLPCAVEQNVVYDSKVLLTYLFPEGLLTTICNIVSQNTLGKGIFAVVDRLLCHYQNPNATN